MRGVLVLVFVGLSFSAVLDPLISEWNGKYFLRTTFEGGPPPAARASRPRVNLVLLIDHSSSMQGVAMQLAKQAADTAASRLADGDVVSVVGFSTYATVLLNPTVVSDANRAHIRHVISSITSDGSTAMYAGLEAALSQAQLWQAGSSNRVLLLSDGQANIGPVAIGDFVSLLQSFQGIPVTTVGLGPSYNEDLLSAISRTSDGLHYFARTPAQVEPLFEKELLLVSNVVARDISIHVAAPGFRSVRVVGDIFLRSFVDTYRISQLYAQQSRTVVFELVDPIGGSGQHRAPTAVTISYTDQGGQKVSKQWHVSSSDNEADRRTVAVEAIKKLAIEESDEVVKLQDRGDLPAAQAKQREQIVGLENLAKQYDSAELEAEVNAAKNNAALIAKESWATARKQIQTNNYMSGCG